MNVRHWEINGNLDDRETGLSNYQTFYDGVVKIKRMYDEVFGHDIFDRIDFYVDNATKDSGYTPISTLVLRRFIVIKLGIKPTDSEARVIYQFAHELMHVVFWAYLGVGKPRANDQEESICTAAALIAVKMFHPKEYALYEKSAFEHSYQGYRDGCLLAREVNFDFNELKKKIDELCVSSADFPTI